MRLKEIKRYDINPKMNVRKILDDMWWIDNFMEGKIKSVRDGREVTVGKQNIW